LIVISPFLRLLQANKMNDESATSRNCFINEDLR
jgi:hypothetical protein